MDTASAHALTKEERHERAILALWSMGGLITVGIGAGMLERLRSEGILLGIFAFVLGVVAAWVLVIRRDHKLFRLALLTAGIVIGYGLGRFYEWVAPNMLSGVCVVFGATPESLGVRAFALAQELTYKIVLALALVLGYIVNRRPWIIFERVHPKEV